VFGAEGIHPFNSPLPSAPNGKNDQRKYPCGANFSFIKRNKKAYQK